MPRVLVAEDNRDSRELVSDILVSLGYTPVLAENGRVALELIHAQPPDLVILDVNMPEVDGFEVCAAVKRNPSTAKIPVIMLTAHTDVESRVTGLGLGADDYLDKPFHPRELIARIETRLRAKAITDDLRAQGEELRRTFERFVGPEIVEQLMEDPTHVKLGGVETVVTVLFADLENFSRVAESAEPTELLDVLNRYHTLMVQHIIANGGTVDKFLGDGVMALYNTPVPQPDHALRAVRTALDIRAALEGMAARLLVERGVSHALTRMLRECLAEGDALFVKRRLGAGDEMLYGRINERFHHAIVDGADNAMIGDLIARLHRVPFVAPSTIAFDRRNAEEMYDDLFHAHREHHAITEALENGEGARVEALLREHVYSQKRSMNLLSYRLDAPAGFSRAASVAG